MKAINEETGIRKPLKEVRSTRRSSDAAISSMPKVGKLIRRRQLRYGHFYKGGLDVQGDDEVQTVAASSTSATTHVEPRLSEKLVCSADSGQ